MPKARPWPDDLEEVCVGCGQREKRLATLSGPWGWNCYQRRHKIMAEREGVAELVTVEPASELFVDDAPTPASLSKERRPGSQGSSVPTSDSDGAPSDSAMPDEGLLGRVRSLFAGAAKAGDSGNNHEKKTNKRERKPGSSRANKRRISLADDVAGFCSWLGDKVGQRDFEGRFNGQHAGLGQYLTFAGPMNGEIIDDAIANTWPDKKLLQPYARTKERAGGIGAVVGIPAMVFTLEENHSLFPVLAPVIYSVLEASADSFLKAQKKADDRAAKRQETLREVYGDAGPGVDPIGAMIARMFPWAFVEPPVHEEEVYHG